LRFVLGFAQWVKDERPADLRSAIVKFENGYKRTLPGDFDYMRLIEVVCEVYGITEDEFHSDFRYGFLGTARQVVCYVLSLYNLTTSEISKMTGFSPSRVVKSVKTIKNKENAENLANDIANMNYALNTPNLPRSFMPDERKRPN
jgi:chromosomal replication initiation ATPase DnaA